MKKKIPTIFARKPLSCFVPLLKDLMKLLSFQLIKDYFCPVHRRRLQLENGCEYIEKCFLVQYQMKFLLMVRLSHTFCTSGYLLSSCTLCLGIACANLLLTKFTLNLGLSMAELELWIIIMIEKFLQYQIKYLPMARLSHAMCTSRYLLWSPACMLCLGIAGANLLITKFTLNLGLSMAELELWIIIIITLGPANSIKL